MRKSNQKKSYSPNSDINFIIPSHEEVEFKDIAKFLDIQMQDNIKKKLEDINEEVENLGKVCDKLYKESSEEYKTIINKEREDLDNNVKKYIYNLKDNLIGLKNRINYDYKGTFLEINERLNKVSGQLNNSTKHSILLKNKIHFLEEDCIFLKKQIEDIKDMNIYLKYKLKLFLGEIEDNNNEKEKEKKENKKLKNEDVKNIINHTNNNINKNSSKNKKIEKEKTINNDSSAKKNVNTVEDKLYLTATKNFANSNHKKKYIKNNEFDEVEYLNSKLNLEEAQLINYIQHEKDKNSKLTEIYNKLYSKIKNPHFSYLSELIDNYNSINASKTLEKNNNISQNSVNNKSYMQSIHSSTLSNSVSMIENKKFYTSENPGHGYIDRKENKEIILNFLESIEAKKVIYKLLYGD